MVDIGYWVKVALVVALSVFLVEHFGRLYKYTYIPTYFIDLAAERCMDIWKVVGRWIARISSFYQYLHVEEMFDTAVNLSASCFRLIIAPPAYMVIGYMEEALTYLNVNLVYWGTATLIVLFSWAVMWYLGYDCASSLSKLQSSLAYYASEKSPSDLRNDQSAN